MSDLRESASLRRVLTELPSQKRQVEPYVLLAPAEDSGGGERRWNLEGREERRTREGALAAFATVSRKQSYLFRRIDGPSQVSVCESRY